MRRQQAVAWMLLVGLPFLSTPTFVQADTTSAAAPKEMSEKELSERLKFYVSVATIEAPFHQTKRLSDLHIELKSEGHFRVKRPDRIVWEVTSPSPVSVTLDPTQITIRSGSDADAKTQTFRANDASMDQDSQSLAGLAAWLNLDAHALASQYRVYGTGERSFRFEPKKTSPFAGLEMTLGADGQLVHLAIREVSGDTLDISFGKPKLTRQ